MLSRYDRFIRPAGEPLGMGGYNGPITGPTISIAGPSGPSVAPLRPNTAISNPVGSVAPTPLAPNTTISSPVGSAPIAPLNPVLGTPTGPSPAGPTSTPGALPTPTRFPSPALPVFGTATSVPGTTPTAASGEEGVPWWLIALLLGGAAGLVYVSRGGAKENPQFTDSFERGFDHAVRLWNSGLTLASISHRPEYDASMYGRGMYAAVEALSGWYDSAARTARMHGYSREAAEALVRSVDSRAR